MLVKKKFIPPSSKWNSWKRNVVCNVEDKELVKTMERSRTATLCNKLHSFNYSYFNRNLMYGTRLHHMNIVNNDICTECHQQENLIHLYWHCQKTVPLWRTVKGMMEKHLGRKLTLAKEAFLLGIIPNTRPFWSKYTKSLFYTLVLLCRHYIHREKCKGKPRSVRGLKTYIKYINENRGGNCQKQKLFEIQPFPA